MFVRAFSSFAAVVCCLLIALAAPVPSAAGADSGVAQDLRDGTPRIVMRGSGTPGSTLTITIEGCPPPTTTPPVPPFMIVIRLNGWTSSAPIPTWDDDAQVWRLVYKIPEGSRGAAVSVTAMMFGTGNATTSSITVQ